MDGEGSIQPRPVVGARARCVICGEEFTITRRHRVGTTCGRVCQATLSCRKWNRSFGSSRLRCRRERPPEARS